MFWLLVGCLRRRRYVECSPLWKWGCPASAFIGSCCRRQSISEAESQFLNYLPAISPNCMLCRRRTQVTMASKPSIDSKLDVEVVRCCLEGEPGQDRYPGDPIYLH